MAPASRQPAERPPVPAAATALPPPGRRLRRAERREQILAAATRAFARAGFAATSLDDIAAEAGISRVIIYRHFESKTDMYRAVLDRVCAHLVESVGEADFDGDSIPALVRAAAAEPDGFRLLFRFAAREPEFRGVVQAFAADSTDIAHRHLAPQIPDPDWAEWAARLVPTVTIEAVIAWLDCGGSDPDRAATRIAAAVRGVIQAAQPDGARPGAE
jgi:AcrR family transcriptional regulator